MAMMMAMMNDADDHNGDDDGDADGDGDDGDDDDDGDDEDDGDDNDDDDGSIPLHDHLRRCHRSSSSNTPYPCDCHHASDHVADYHYHHHQYHYRHNDHGHEDTHLRDHHQ